jgi:hypothetical protein
MADRAYHPQFAAKNSRSGLPTILDDASFAQSESSSVAISDASSVKSSEYAASLISDCLSETSSDCSTSLDALNESDASSSGSDSFDTDIEVAARSATHPRSKRSEMIEDAGEGKECTPIDLTDLEAGNESARVTGGDTHAVDPAKRRDVDEGKKFTRVNATVGQPHDLGQARLQGVHYVSSLDVASTHRGLSVVEPIGKRQARDAFHRYIPSTIPIDSERDDLSSIGAVFMKPPRVSMSSNDYRRRAWEEVRPERQTQAPYDHEQEDSTKGPCFLGRRTDMEVLFITIISVSVFILVVLLAIILAK